MEHQEFQMLLKEAMKRVASLDKADGFRDREPATIRAALQCGILRPETNAQFDALVMLMDVEKSAPVIFSNANNN